MKSCISISLTQSTIRYIFSTKSTCVWNVRQHKWLIVAKFSHMFFAIFFFFSFVSTSQKILFQSLRFHQLQIFIIYLSFDYYFSRQHDRCFESDLSNSRNSVRPRYLQYRIREKLWKTQNCVKNARYYFVNYDVKRQNQNSNRVHVRARQFDFQKRFFFFNFDDENLSWSNDEIFEC